MSDSAFKLVNPEFDFEFNGKSYRIRKANLDKAIQYQSKVKELNDAKDPAAHLSIVAFCIFIMLKDKEPELTLEQVRDNTPGDIEPVEILTTLGFISPDRMKRTKEMEDAIAARISTSQTSSH